MIIHFSFCHRSLSCSWWHFQLGIPKKPQESWNILSSKDFQSNSWLLRTLQESHTLCLGALVKHSLNCEPWSRDHFLGEPLPVPKGAGAGTGIPAGNVAWEFQLGRLYGNSNWECDMGIPAGNVTWEFQLGRLHGNSSWECCTGIPGLAPSTAQSSPPAVQR